MPINSCRVCGRRFDTKPAISFLNVPKVAQNLPSAKTINRDFGVNINVFECSGCGLVQLSNDPVNYYKNVIRATAFSEEMRDFRIKQFSIFIKKYFLKNKKIVEIGCGKGEYLSLMNLCGGNVFGIEYAQDSVNFCKDKGLAVEKTYLSRENQIIKMAPFDAFFILNYLEHIPNINTMLGAIRNNLNEEAVGLVEVPNFNMMVKNKLFSEFTTDHLYYFSKDTITRVMGLNGFDVVDCGKVWHDYIISIVVKKRKKIDMYPITKYKMKIIKDIDTYVDLNFGSNIAVWGAGHQALMVLSMMRNYKYIDCVIDSAKFKQGKYTPVTHIPIVSPDVLLNKQLKSIIVMAASFSDEVVKIIKNKYPWISRLVVLREFGLEVVLKGEND